MKMNEEKDELNLITLAQQYSDDDKARELLESLLWLHGAYCPHCKADMPYKLTKEPPLSLHGVKFEDAVRALLHTPPPKPQKAK